MLLKLIVTIPHRKRCAMDGIDLKKLNMQAKKSVPTMMIKATGPLVMMANAQNAALRKV